VRSSLSETTAAGSNTEPDCGTNKEIVPGWDRLTFLAVFINMVTNDLAVCRPCGCLKTLERSYGAEVTALGFSFGEELVAMVQKGRG
jgi:hypothetical protein